MTGSSGDKQYQALHDRAMSLPSIPDLRDLVKLPHDASTHIGNLERAYADARAIIDGLLDCCAPSAERRIDPSGGPAILPFHIAERLRKSAQDWPSVNVSTASLMEEAADALERLARSHVATTCEHGQAKECEQCFDLASPINAASQSTGCTIAAGKSASATGERADAHLPASAAPSSRGQRAMAASHGILPDCMLPDGAEPCAAYQYLEQELKAARSATATSTPAAVGHWNGEKMVTDAKPVYWQVGWGRLEQRASGAIVIGSVSDEKTEEHKVGLYAEVTISVPTDGGGA